MALALNIRAFAQCYPRNAAATSLFNVVCALIVTYVIRVDTGFLENLVFSMCIGMLAQLLIDGGRLLLWGDGAPPRLPFILLLALSAPTAYFAGMTLAAALLGIPAENVAVDFARHDTTGPLILTILACLFGSWMFWSRGRLAQLQAEAQAEKARAAAIEKQALQAQLQLLQAQIEPHMLFNTLANLQGLIAIDAARAQQMLDQLILYLRATLSSARAQQTTLVQEFALMEAYFGLMSVRMGPRLSYALALPAPLRDLPLPPMLLQPLVENAIRHGLEPKIDGGRVEVQAAIENGLLTLTVADNGLGLDAAELNGSSGTGVGLANVRERLQALYGERACFMLTPNTPSGVIARITIPL